ncbi:hypothetical protein NQ317_005518 [Molorchus minor]|uniref:Thymidylate kinase-like domain-containing protein n=1 Tax=Molorchus minor TaxID=1323400 RepID=A0ABQ9J2C0_9CUCU|nr:hypothetical protein NQ317_005518 [Molorchus minor]
MTWQRQFSTLRQIKFISSLFTHSVSHFSIKKYFDFSQTINMTTPLIYHSLESILNLLEKSENKNVDGVNELLDIYNNANGQKMKHEASGELKKYPLIILEGLDGSGKSTVGKRVAKKLNAVQWRTPPDSINHLRHLFETNSILRTAYYSMGNYIAALEVQLILKDKPVVMDRFWHSTAAYAIAQAVEDYPDKYEMPPANDKIYCWPEDLFRPDIVLLLDVSEQVRLQRLSRRKSYTAQENLLKDCSKFRQK